MKIGEVAQRSGVSTKAIRYYETIGVVQSPPRSANGYREYEDAVVDRLAFIRAAQASGLTLAEIRSVVASRDRGEAPCDQVRSMIGQRAAEIDRQIDELRATRAHLAGLARRARHVDPAACDPKAVCEIITTPT
jgi:DNA-binding transcriptional MerR regulator